MEEKHWNRRILDVIGTLIIVIVVSIIIRNNNIMVTLPITIILAFCLFFIQYNIGWMIITSLIIHIMLGNAMKSWIILNVFHSVIELCTGYYLARCLKNILRDWKLPKNILQLIFSIVLTLIAIASHIQSYGSPMGYIESKNKVINYISNTYNNELEITGIHYNPKMMEYIIDVKSKKDSRDEGSIFCSRNGFVGDDYHFRIVMNQVEMLQNTLILLINQKTGIESQNIKLDVNLTLPYNQYSKRDIYSGKEPLSIALTMNPNGEKSYYQSQDDFAKDAYKVLMILKDLSFQYKNIEIASYLEDGNTTYSISLNEPIKIESLNKIKDVIEVIKQK